MSIHRVLPKHQEKAQERIAFVNHCMAQQRQALAEKDEAAFHKWVKDARLARRELAEMYRVKEQYDQERERIRNVIRELKSRGVKVEVVQRVHNITLCEEVI